MKKNSLNPPIRGSIAGLIKALVVVLIIALGLNPPIRGSIADRDDDSCCNYVIGLNPPIRGSIVYR